MGRIAIDIPREAVGEFCRRSHIRRLAIFGSALRDDFGPDSDIDVLVEFEAGRVPGLAIVDMAEELSRILGRRVDLRTREELSRHFREEVVSSAEVVHEQA